MLDVYDPYAEDVFSTYGAIPTENGVALDQLNDALRRSPAWQRFMIQRFGTNPQDPTSANPIVRLTDNDRRLLQSEIERYIGPFPDGMEIDPGGNVNQNQGFWAHWYFWVPALAAATIITMGVAGWGPLAGVLSAGGGGGAAAGVAAAGGGGAAAAAGTGAGTAAAIVGAASAVVPRIVNTFQGNGGSTTAPTTTTAPRTSAPPLNSSQVGLLAVVGAVLLFSGH